MKRLNVTIQCLALYNSGIDVPEHMTIEEATEYAKENIDKIPLGPLEYVMGSDALDEDNCDFEEQCQ